MYMVHVAIYACVNKVQKYLTNVHSVEKKQAGKKYIGVDDIINLIKSINLYDDGIFINNLQV